jgi:2-oxoglutarate dehydrogenase E1 component
MSGANANYIDHVYAQWQQDPSSVHASWNAYFSSDGSFDLPPTLGAQSGGLDGQIAQIVSALQGSGGMASNSADTARAQDEAVRLTMLLRAYMTHGHFNSELDPLNLREHYKDFPSLYEKMRLPTKEIATMLEPKKYGFTEADLDKEIHFKSPFGGSILQKKSNWKLRDLLDAYNQAYCGKIGCQFMHIEDKAKCDWIRDRIEGVIYEEKTPA